MIDMILTDKYVSVIVLMILSTALLIALLELARSFFITKRAELLLADQALKRHFAALKKIMDDEVVSTDVKHLLLQISAAFCQKQVAKRIAEGIKTGKKPILSPDRQKVLEIVMEEIMSFRNKRKDLAQAIMEAVNFGFASMVLRWPETEIMIARAVMFDAEGNNIQQKAACVLAQVDNISPMMPQGALQSV